ncbi:MAG: hypothetical protein C0483_23175 [Pirellula sp.]|nr:hypothetical protein [Pirellula sp.]
MTIAVFLSGLVVGSGTTIFILHQQRLRMFRDPEAINQKLLAEVEEEFKLDATQLAAVEIVLKRRQEAFERTRTEIHSRVEAEFALLESQVAEVLPADQRPRWHTYFKEFRSQWMPPPPPPTVSTAGESPPAS